jgi:hypothetical protein
MKEKSLTNALPDTLEALRDIDRFIIESVVTKNSIMRSEFHTDDKLKPALDRLEELIECYNARHKDKKEGKSEFTDLYEELELVSRKLLQRCHVDNEYIPALKHLYDAQKECMRLGELK